MNETAMEIQGVGKRRIRAPQKTQLEKKNKKNRKKNAKPQKTTQQKKHNSL